MHDTSTRAVARRWTTGLAATVLTVGVCAAGAIVAPAGASAAPVASKAAASTPVTGNRLLKTPPMGFNDWNAFGCNVSEKLIEQTADFMVSSGLRADGYKYVNIDDCWLEKTRSASGHLVPDPTKFPDGIKGTAAYVHSKGLKLGIYESAGTKTCAGYPGSLGHEQTDADDFAAWGVDYLKYDNCSNNSDGSLKDYKQRYAAMGRALANSGRKIVYSLCEWGVNNPSRWGSQTGATLWRTTGDISDNWASLKSIISQNAKLAQYAHPGAWNDPDMLEVGNGGMTDTEYKTHFGLWAEMASPLIIGTDLRTASPETVKILSNKALIAVDQDSLGVQGRVIAKHAGTMVFNKPLANGDRAVALYNSTDAPARISTTSAQAGLAKSRAYRLNNLWSGARTESAGTIAATVPAHGTVMYRVSAAREWQNLAPSTDATLSGKSGFGASVATVAAGGSATVTSTVSDYGREALRGVRASLDVPDGWTVKALDATNARRVGSNKDLVTRWRVTAPDNAASGNVSMALTVSYRHGRQVASTVTHANVLVPPAAPSGTVDVSSLNWLSATNGWGPVEKNMSNGDTAAGDGKTITIRGTTYAKGLGTNATSDVVYYLGGKCSSLKTDVGIDDEVGTSGGSVIFQVYAGNKKVADSGVVTNTSKVMSLTASLTGAKWLRLHVDPNGSTNYDHADWAAPTLTCS